MAEERHKWDIPIIWNGYKAKRIVPPSDLWLEEGATKITFTREGAVFHLRRLGVRRRGLVMDAIVAANGNWVSF